MPSDQDEPSPDPLADAPQAPRHQAATAVAMLDADDPSLSRRQVLAGAGGAGLLAASPIPITLQRPQQHRTAAAGTPEQIHLTWGRDPATSIAVSWASPGPAVRPRLLLAGPGGRSVAAPAVRRGYTDGISGELVWTYHAQATGLTPATTYCYCVTADDDSPDTAFSATFRTAPRGRTPFRFTSFGDLATPNTQWVLSYGQSAHAVAAVESFQPLFHLLNGDLRSVRSLRLALGWALCADQGFAAAG